MEEEETITEFMKIDHGIMYELLATFRMRIERSGYMKRALDAFNKFKDKEKTHISIEENIIFKSNPKAKEIKVLEIIKKQHIVMIEIVKKIEKDLEDKKDPNPDTETLQEFMRKHIRLEETRFYPVLDKKLSSKEKQELLDKIQKSSE